MMSCEDGILSDTSVYERSLGINVNLWWGTAMLAFGGVMLLFSWKSLRKK
jgi:hypothetical protein